MKREIKLAFFALAVLGCVLATHAMALTSVAHPADNQTPARGPSGHLAHHGDITSVEDVAARASSATVVINTVGFTWSPNDVTIQAGDSVMWNANFVFHPLRQVDGPNSDTPPPGGFAYSGPAASFTYQFNSAGTFYYQCSNHGLAQFGGTMRGRIVVQAASGTNTVTPTSTPTATGTLVPSTSTPTPTSTLASPTSTPTATGTFVSSTSTPTPTGTLAPPTSTPTANATFVPSTITLTPTGILASPTSTPTATGTPVKPQWMLFLPLVLR